MKKFIMTFLVAGLMITSVLSLSSCKKTDTNAGAKEEWVPMVYTFINTNDGEGYLRQGAPKIPCYYCNDSIVKCEDVLIWENKAFYCEEHSHVHCFEANQDCTAPNQITECEYKNHRRHYHILTYTPGYYWHGWHVGGGSCPF